MNQADGNSDTAKSTSSAYSVQVGFRIGFVSGIIGKVLATHQENIETVSSDQATYIINY